MAAPSPAKLCASTRPSPEPLPVIMTTRLWNRIFTPYTRLCLQHATWHGPEYSKRQTFGPCRARLGRRVRGRGDPQSLNWKQGNEHLRGGSRETGIAARVILSEANLLFA